MWRKRSLGLGDLEGKGLRLPEVARVAEVGEVVGEGVLALVHLPAEREVERAAEDSGGPKLVDILDRGKKEKEKEKREGKEGELRRDQAPSE